MINNFYIHLFLSDHWYDKYLTIVDTLSDQDMKNTLVKLLCDGYNSA